MAIISDQLKLIFILNPRTGSTALANLIEKQMGGYWVPKSDMLREDGKIEVQSKYTTIEQLIHFKLIDNHKISNYLKFTTVRNPFDSLVSLWTKKKYKYFDKIKDPNSFVNKIPGYANDMEFIRNHSFSEWVMYLYNDKKQAVINFKYTHGVDKFIRFESMQSDFDSLISELGVLKKFLIPVVNVTEERIGHYRDYYDNDARSVVEKVFQRELDFFNYYF